MKLLLPTYEIIEEIHAVVIETSGGKQGVPHPEFIHQAVQRPYNYLSYHPGDVDVHTVCAVIVDALARHHAFTDGNKRTAVMALTLVYEVNGIHILLSPEAQRLIEELVLDIVCQHWSVGYTAGELRRLVGNHAVSHGITGRNTVKELSQEIEI